MNFGSDNTGPAHPAIMEALARANEGYALPYGDEPMMDQVRNRVRDVFEAPEAEVILVATGTAANSLCLSSLVKPWGAIYCSRVAHIHVDECGAPEFYSGGAKLVLVDELSAKITPVDLTLAITEGLDRGLHYVQPGVVSLTQVTERGTIYSLSQIQALTEVARSFGLPVHMDGARFANALVALGATPAEMSWKSGIDALSLGATKNGCLGVEAVVVFDPNHASELEFRRKRAGHLFSKHRYLAAQMLAYLEDGLWLKLAQAANRSARRLADGLHQIAGATFDHPTDANMLFLALPRQAHQRAIAAGAEYFLTQEDIAEGDPNDAISVRMVSNWSTTDQEVDQFLELVG